MFASVAVPPDPEQHCSGEQLHDRVPGPHRPGGHHAQQRGQPPVAPPAGQCQSSATLDTPKSVLQMPSHDSL